MFLGNKMPKIRFRGVSDDLWEKVETLIPVAERPSGREYQRKSGGGRKPMLTRQVFTAIIYVLRSGCAWKALPKRLGSASTVHRHYQQWESKGFFQALWRAGLAEHADLEGISWDWQIAGRVVEVEARSLCNKGNETGETVAPGRLVVPRGWRPSISRRVREKKEDRHIPHPASHISFIPNR
jgi:transposase